MRELLESMSFQEYVLWLKFFNKRPLGWREDMRAYRLMCSSGNMPKNAKPGDWFSSLAQMSEAEAAENKAIPHRGTFVHTALMNARGGAKLEFLENL